MAWFFPMDELLLLIKNNNQHSIKAFTFLGLSFEFSSSELPTNLYTSFCWFNTNDAGEPLLAQTAHILFGEFKKFMIQNAALVVGKTLTYNYFLLE